VRTSEFRLDFENTQWEHPLPGCRFKSIIKGNRQVRLLEFSNDFIEPDWCRKGHAGVVLEGDLEIDFQGKIVQFPQGSALLIPAGDEGAHKARALTRHALLFLVEDA
jgi:quercetin dioxygenase-like cupin family protein